MKKDFARKKKKHYLCSPFDSDFFLKAQHQKGSKEKREQTQAIK